jgi:hypothetical protein
MIYFITARELGRVKIGYSAEPRGRFVKMRTDSPVPLVLERVTEGEFANERALHARFSESRLDGEWFTLSPEIEDHMAALPQASSPESYGRPKGQIAALMDALKCSYSYASKMLNGHRPITIPVALRVFRQSGVLVGPLSDATETEIDVLEKYLGQFSRQSSTPTQGEAA